jgi:excisionase family DNA binding protein
MPDYDERDYMTVQEVVDTYGVKASWVYDQISAGKIAAYQLPGKRGMHMLRRDVVEFMRPKRVNPSATSSEPA